MENKFEKLGLSSGIVSVLKKAGITEPTEIQEKTIPLALAGQDIIGGSATGSGKTLAFAAPIVEKIKSNGHVQTLVLTPTRELADQVSEEIMKFSQNKFLNVLAVYGGVDIQKQLRKLARTDILVGTPGRVLDHLNRRSLRLDKINFLVLDEVDRMFDMGFQKDVESILKECSKERQTMLFSATISPDIDYLSKKHTRDAREISVQSNVDPSKLKQIYYDVETHNKFSLLVHLLKNEKSNLVMVFCSTRRNADFVAMNLTNVGIKARAIHGGLVQNKRTKIMKDFQDDNIKVLVCTDVAARGLDIKGVSHVYNYDIPKDTKDYIHRIGRTARAGKDGIAINILASRDYENFSNIVNREPVNIESVSLPNFSNIRVKIDSGRSVGRSSRGGFGSRDRSSNSRSRDPSRGRSGGNRDSRSSGGRSFGNRDSGRSSRGKSSGGRDSRSFGSRRY